MTVHRRIRTSRREPRQPGEDYLKSEAARALRISRSSLDYAVAAGKINCQKYGRHVTFTETQIAEYRLLNERVMDVDEKSRLVGIVLQHLDDLAAIAAHRDAFFEQCRRVA